MIKIQKHLIPGFIGAVLISHALWLPAKAQLGQFLLHRNWQQVLAGEAETSPWPGADMRTIAQLEVPALEIRQLLVSGQQGKNLAWAPGLVSAGLPGFSDTVISAHRDSHFRFLKDIKIGERMVLKTANEVFRYIVKDLEVIDSATSTLQLQSEGNHLILTTCYPFDSLKTGGSLRYVVTAKRDDII